MRTFGTVISNSDAEQTAKEPSVYERLVFTRHVPAVERADVTNVAEDGLLVTADFRRRALLVDVLEMARCDEVHLLYKLLLAANELLDDLAFHRPDIKQVN